LPGKPAASGKRGLTASTRPTFRRLWTGAVPGTGHIPACLSSWDRTHPCVRRIPALRILCVLRASAVSAPVVYATCQTSFKAILAWWLPRAG